jgi:hypothetical protein
LCSRWQTCDNDSARDAGFALFQFGTACYFALRRDAFTPYQENSMKRLAFALVLLAASAGSALAADSPFTGTWKLNVDKSKFTGDTFTYSATATGFHYSNGATIEYDFAIDGKDYPTIVDRTVSWTKAGDDSWDTVAKDAKGTVLSKAHRVLSADGKKLTVTYTSYRPDGTTAEGSDEYLRISGGPGLAGKWKDAKAKVASSSLVISIPTPGQVSVEYPSFKETMTGPTDGTPIAVKGPTIPDGVFISYKPAGSDKWEFAETLNDKPWRKGTMTVSSGGKILTEVSWIPGKESEKEIEVWDKE